MTNLSIQSIHYKNFKGLTDFKLDLSGKSAVISGRNGSGKTTLADGFLWLLFGKDSKGSKLNPKPLDKDNNEVLGLEPTVEAVITVDGSTVNLKRVLEEKWTTPRGQLEKIRGNDTTKYYIDTVPTKEKDWKEYLAKIGDDALLQLLSDSTFFMKMDWKERRKILVNMTGLTDKEIFESDPELNELVKILEDRSVEDLRKILVGQKKEVKKQIDGVPARIQEVTDMANKGKEDLADKTPEKCHEAIAYYEIEIQENERKLASVNNGNAALDFQEALSNARVELSEAKNTFLAEASLSTQSLSNDLAAQQHKLNGLRQKESKLKGKRFGIKQAVEEKQMKLDSLKNEYRQIKEVSFDEHRKNCPTCGQSLPENQIDEMVTAFNVKKSTDLEQNISLGKGTKQDVQSLEKELSDVELELNAVSAEIEPVMGQVDLINSELTFAQSNVGTFEETDVYKRLQNKIFEVEQKIRHATSDTTQAEQELKQKIADDKQRVQAMHYTLQQFENLKQFDDRIVELKKEDKRLKEQNQEIERKLFLLDEFTRKKVKRLEESINNKFSIVKFKLFNILKNGNLEEVCEATFNGVEYGTSLNNGARINCDLDIIRTLSRELGITMPVFVDNAESVNTLQPIEGQMIELQVTEDEKLKVEV